MLEIYPPEAQLNLALHQETIRLQGTEEQRVIFRQLSPEVENWVKDLRPLRKMDHFIHQHRIVEEIL